MTDRKFEVPPPPRRNVVNAALGNIDISVEMIMAFIDDATLPAFMHKAAKYDVLMQVKHQVDERMQAIVDEIRAKAR